MIDDLCRLSIADAAKLIEKRAISPLELTEAVLRRIESFNPKLDAFLTISAEQAKAQARAAEQEIVSGSYRGALHGIPIGLKDIYKTAGVRTTGHSRVFSTYVPTHDATVVARLREAGAVIVGKLATHEFAWGGPSLDLPWPPARNPWSLAHFTGGSSSGSASALAARLIPAALGSDTGGSIRTPASLCGVTGFKPTYGLVSRAGVFPNSYSFDHCGPMARTAEDCALLLEAMAGFDEDDPTTLSAPVPHYASGLDGEIRGLRIGVIRHFWEEDAQQSEEFCKAMDAALDVLALLGALIEDIRVAPLRHYRDVKMSISGPETFATYQPYMQRQPKDFGFDFRARILGCCLFSGSTYVQAQRARRKLLTGMKPLYRRYDAFVTAASGPASRVDAFRSTNFWSKPNLYNPFNVTGGPAASICIGFSAGGLPMGMQVAGAPLADQMALRIAHAYQQATAWHLKEPLLTPETPKTTLEIPMTADAGDVDQETREFARQSATRAGLELDDELYGQLFEAAPFALAMSRRIATDNPVELEPASIFVVPGPGRSSDGTQAGGVG